MRERREHIALLSEHASPLALLGGEDAGGQNVYVAELSRHLASCGYAIDIFTRRESLGQPEIVQWQEGVRVIHLEAGPALILPKDAIWPFMPAFREALLRFIARESVAYTLLHGNFWMAGQVAIDLQQRLGIPAVQIFHALGMTKRRHQQEEDSSPNERIPVEREIVHRAAHLIAQCPSERQELIADYGADPARIALIPAGVDPVRFRPLPLTEARRRLGLPEQGAILVYVGRLLPRKDVRSVIQALALLVHRYGYDGTERPPITLVVVGGETTEPDPGTTPEMAILQRLAVELGVSERVLFTGRRQPAVLPLFYSAGDIAVTTPWYEPFGLTPLEAMACARPVVASAVGGITYTVLDGETGLLVPPRDPEALAARLHMLLTAPALRERMGQAARRRVEQTFTWRLTALRTAALYEAVRAAWHARGEGEGPFNKEVAGWLPTATSEVAGPARIEEVQAPWPW
ncbi:glycosyltransferase [Thermogemmatispora sp.]|uniref:glycosyltransferase n=1 Tax=Thermogemmatispora sp. TaxID=1968838 RepID=UPI0035E41319